MTKIMGIINATPDSFYSDSRCTTFQEAVERGIQLFKEGADILDIGGESTRPGALPILAEVEKERVIPLIQALRKAVPIQISIDTRKPEVARAALAAGATLINDVSGFTDPAMQEIAASANVDICVMHMQGDPQTMQIKPGYAEGIIPFLINWFEIQTNFLIQKGVKEKHIILDPGIGFGKSFADNVEIIQNLPRLKTLGFPLLLGISRKSFLGKLLGLKSPGDLLPATLAVSSLLVQAKVEVIRVHDVSAHRNLIDVLSKIVK